MRVFRGREAGFSMIEVMVAILVFGLITVGMTPLLLSSLRGSALARTQTAGKNVVSEAMERVRGLPFFDTAAGRDVLDLYFPNVGTGYDATTRTFTTTCTSTTSAPSPSADKGCPRLPDGSSKIPAGYTLTFAATFVTPSGTPETFNPQAPATTYNSAAAGTATPPTSLLRMVIRATWPFQGATKSFELVSLVGSRRLSTDKVRANATIDYVVQALTSFRDVTARTSGLTSFFGRNVSSVEVRNFAAALTEANAGEAVLARGQTDTESGTELGSAQGAVATLRAPADVSPAPVTSLNDPQTINHPDLARSVLMLGPSSVNQTNPVSEVKVPNALPRASTNFEFTGGVGQLFWVNNQADVSDTAIRKLDPLQPVFSVSRTNLARKTRGWTSAEATALLPAASREVKAIAHAESNRMALLPTTFAGSGVVRIVDFVAELTCRSTGPLGAPTVTGSWSATFEYWRDTNPADDLAVGGYRTVETVAGSTKLSGTIGSSAVDPLAAIKTENPLVYDSVVPTSDIYLFETTTQAGYLDHWSSSPLIVSTTANQSARANVPYAIQLVTAKTDPANPETKLTISIGKMSCDATDLR